jgi:hypothetical protein
MITQKELSTVTLVSISPISFLSFLPDKSTVHTRRRIGRALEGGEVSGQLLLEVAAASLPMILAARGSHSWKILDWLLMTFHACVKIKEPKRA